MDRVLLVLVGAPGSGKSTFARSLQLNNPVVWIRANQDQLKTRKKCEQVVRQTLAGGQCCIVDRCNFDYAQRSTWLALAAEFAVPCCALWLAAPAEVAAQRAAQRPVHEGGVVGPEARAISFRIARQIVAPTVAEGFLHVATAQSDADVAAALQCWRAFGSAPMDVVLRGLDQLPMRRRSPFHAAPSFRSPPAPSQPRPRPSQPRPPAAAQAPFAPGAPPRRAPQGGMPAGPPPSAPPSAAPSAAVAPAAASPEAVVDLTEDDGADRHPPGAAGASLGAVAASVGVARPGAARAIAKSGAPPAAPTDLLPTRNAFAALMSASKGAPSPPRGHKRHAEGESPPRGADDAGERSSDGAGPSGRGHAGGGRAGAGRGHDWSALFVGWVRDPEALRQQQPSTYVAHDDQILVVNDAYRKARLHVLVIARDPQLPGLSSLRREHLGLLRHMKAAADEWAASHAADVGEVGLAIGFHWIPSMKQLHLHVISRDFVSDCLKTPKHWKSFTTAFFRPFDAVVAEIEAHGRPVIDVAAANALLKGPLLCHRCLAPQSNLPALKRHILACTAAVQRP